MNFADRVANELTRRGRNVLPPILIQGGGKISMTKLGKLDQIVCNSEEYYSEFVDKLLEKIPDYAGLQFVQLVLPSKAINKAEHLISGNVHLRYLEGFTPHTDEKAKRWDALIRLPNDYVVVGNEDKVL